MAADLRGSVSGRLRNLRWVLTGIFTGLNAIGLLVFAWLVVDEDAEQTRQGLDSELRRVTSTVTRLLDYDDRLSTVLIGQDELATRCPQFAVLPGDTGGFSPYLSERRCTAVDTNVLAGIAKEATRTGRLINGYVEGSDGATVRVGAEPFRNPSGQYIGAVVAASDASDDLGSHDRLTLLVMGGCVLLIVIVGAAGYIIAGRAIKPASDAFEQQEKLLAETAHDLRTPVAALRALAETALRHPDQRAEMLPRTVRLAGRMGSIIDGLLIRARLAAGVEVLAIQPVWLDQLVGGVVEETPSDGARITLTTAPTKVDADPVLLQRAIGNLLDNALRHGRNQETQTFVHVAVAGGRVTVADNGPGFDASVVDEDLERIVSGSGSNGLGLSIVRWVAQAHGGVLRVYNADQGGAIFELELPFRPS